MRPVILTLSIMLSSGAQALDTLGSEELLALCQSGSERDVAACTGYINGFLDGAFATDPSVVDGVVSEMRDEESYSQRAIRTRLGIKLERYGPSYYAGFCIPGDLAMDEILAEVKEAAKQESGDTSRHNARDYLYQLLQSQHPCVEED